MAEGAAAALECLERCARAATASDGSDTDEGARALEEADAAFQKTLDSEEREFYRSRVRWWMLNGMTSWEIDEPATLDRQWARRWVCKRAHELGWSERLHGGLDGRRIVQRDRMDHRVERIGKKYQWLALYELVARLADNYAAVGSLGRDRTAGRYEGEAGGGLRNIDPSLLVKSTYDDGWTQFRDPTWWTPVVPKLRAMQPLDRLQWLYDDTDMINDRRWLEVTDPAGCHWLTLHCFLNVRQGSRESDGAESETWARLNCIVIDKDRLQEFVSGARGTILTEPHALLHPTLIGHDLYLGEYGWHAASSEREEWTDPEDAFAVLPVPAGPTAAQYTGEREGYDNSLDQTVHAQLPATWLMDALSLRMSNGREIGFVDREGTVRFFDPSVRNKGPKAGLVDRDAFLAALDRKGFAAIWIISGEKNVYGGGTPPGFGGRHRFTSLYWREQGEWRHEDHSDLVPPSREQLISVLGEEPPGWVRTKE